MRVCVCPILPSMVLYSLGPKRNAVSCVFICYVVLYALYVSTKSVGSWERTRGFCGYGPDLATGAIGALLNIKVFTQESSFARSESRIIMSTRTHARAFWSSGSAHCLWQNDVMIFRGGGVGWPPVCSNVCPFEYDQYEMWEKVSARIQTNVRRSDRSFGVLWRF